MDGQLHVQSSFALYIILLTVHGQVKKSFALWIVKN